MRTCPLNIEKSIGSRMVRYITVSGVEMCDMDVESRFGPMEQDMKESGRIIKRTERVNSGT
jgi:hypothetical protein